MARRAKILLPDRSPLAEPRLGPRWFAAASALIGGAASFALGLLNATRLWTPLPPRIALPMLGLGFGLLAAGVAAGLPAAAGAVRRSRRAGQAERYPLQPWLWDFDWDRAGIDDLAATARLTFDGFPFFLGSQLRGHLRLPQIGASAEPWRLTLRFVEEQDEPDERDVGAVTTAGVCYQRYADEREIDDARSLPLTSSALPVTFDLPTDMPPTSLSLRPRSYWELAARAPGGREARFLLPVYSALVSPPCADSAAAASTVAEIERELVGAAIGQSQPSR